MLQVRDLMTTPVVTVKPDSNYMNALRLMQDRKLHHLPVVDATGNLVGILAERDLLVGAMHFMQNPVEVEEVMHRGVVTVKPETPVSEAAKLMVDHGIGGLPVMDEAAHVIGIVTEKDLFRAFVQMLAKE